MTDSGGGQTPYDQHGSSARLRWGRRGAIHAAALGEILVVVDVLSFSTGVSYALDRGVTVFPCPPGEGEALARKLDATLAAALDALSCVPRLQAGAFVEASAA
ncbi:MAG: hypothetical protein JKY65_30275 [Planctomycetes bacterium]|nr:hypothetical protein [Planctomycetota bacterium]